MWTAVWGLHRHKDMAPIILSPWQDFSSPKNPFHVSASVTERSSPGCFWHTVKYLHRFLWAQIGFLRCGELANSWDYTNYLLFLKYNLPCKPLLTMLHLHLLCFSRQKNTFEWGKLGAQTLQRWSCDSFQFPIPREEEGVGSYSVSKHLEFFLQEIKLCSCV